MALKFEWDAKKAAANIKKHNVSSEEARTIFGDPFARISEDIEHSEYEQRWYVIGQSDRQRVLVVAYTERKKFIRIITERPAEATFTFS